ncbi:hypothetical protein ACHAXS_014029 [Conticribra weissflogii]
MSNSSNNPTDSTLWRDVCLASAWFDRAKTLLSSRNTSPPLDKNNSHDNSDCAFCAEKAMKLYQSCYKRVKKRSGIVQKRASSCSDSGSFTTTPSMASGLERSDVSWNGATAAGTALQNSTKLFTVNLELRMAQTLRFLAMIHTMKNDFRTPTSLKEEEIISNLEAAIKCHDDAVSLLVGVFDFPEDDEMDSNTDGSNAVVVRNESDGYLEKGRQDRESQPLHSGSYEEHDPDMSASAMSEEISHVFKKERILHTIYITNDDKNLGEHLKTTNIAGSDDSLQLEKASIIQVTFLLPSEDQRVRAIAVSLNALAQLHAKCGDDRAAMDAYKDALEILRAATEEGIRDYDENDDNDFFLPGEKEGWSEGNSASHSGAVKQGCGAEFRDGGSSTHQSCSNNTSLSPTRAEMLLSATLMNVGNYHLRRDELDAALNAHSTAWALHTGHSLEDTSVNSSGLAVPHLHHLCHGSSNSSNHAEHSIPHSHCSPGALAALNNLGIVHERRGELEDALLCHDQVRVARIMTKAPSIDVANSWINVGNCLQRLQDFDKAVEAYEEAVFLFNEELKDQSLTSDFGIAERVRLFRSLSGTLRNWGTCYLKQRQISDAIEQLNEAVYVENELISLLSINEPLVGGFHEAILQAEESMTQLMRILSCLYVEQQRKSDMKGHIFENAEAIFKFAIDVYVDLGYKDHHPSMVWARKNLDAVLSVAERYKNPPPPPPTQPPTKRRSPQSALKTRVSASERSERAISSRDDDDSVFSGVEDDDSESKALDDILGESTNSKPIAPADLVADGDSKETVQQFDEEVDLDEGCENIDEEKVGLQCSTPFEESVDLVTNTLANEHRSNSSSLFSQHSGDKSTDVNLNTCAENVREQKGRFGSDSIEAADAIVALACQYWEKGDRVTATELYTEAHSAYQNKLGDSKEVAMVLKSLGDLNKEDEKFDAARHLYMEALEMEQDVYGHCLPQTLNAVGILCLEQDDFRAAMEYHRRALQIQKKQSSRGEQSKYEMYETLVRIGNVYYSERNNLTNIRSKGVDYKDFIASGFLGWIANAHDMRGEYSKSKQFYEELLQISTTKDTKEAKRETALTLNRLGSLSRELGLYDEAMDYHQRALHLQQSTSSAAKAMTAETCVLMGMTKSKMCEYKRALDLFEDALLVLKSSLGKRHSSDSVAITLSQIGAVYFELGDFNKAMTTLTEAERNQISSIGENSRDTLETQAMIGRVLCRLGEYDTALKKLRDVVKKQMTLFGASHPSIADTKQYIGEVFLEQGMTSEARAMYIDSYNMRKLFFGMDQIHIAESMVDIIRAREGKPEQALAVYKNAMDVYKEYLSDDHVQIGRLLMFEGDAHAELLDFSTAIERYEKAKQIFLDVLDEGHVIEADVAVNLGKVLLRKCDYDGAKDYFYRALEIYQAKLPESHPKISRALLHLDRVEQEEALCV